RSGGRARGAPDSPAVAQEISDVEYVATKLKSVGLAAEQECDVLQDAEIHVAEPGIQAAEPFGNLPPVRVEVIVLPDERIERSPLMGGGHCIAVLVRMGVECDVARAFRYVHEVV